MSGNVISYQEPNAVQLLVLSSFLLLLNVSRYIVNHALYAGLLGEIAIGVIYGAPLAGILNQAWEVTFLVLGYIGLILIVFQGGLEVADQRKLLLGNLPLSIICALVGGAVPICLSLLLLHVGYGYSLLEAFAAGSALSSTSLGTTLFLLQHLQSTSRVDVNLRKTRVGVVLMTAALGDDVVALILLSLISSLGANSAVGSNSNQAIGWAVARPLLSSLGLAIVIPLLAIYMLRPAVQRYAHPRLITLSSHMRSQIVLIAMIALLSGLVSIAYYAGSTMLLGAFLAGFSMQTIMQLPIHQQADPDRQQPPTQQYQARARGQGADGYAVGDVNGDRVGDWQNPTPHTIYMNELERLVNYMLAPLFFASIGYGMYSIHTIDCTHLELLLSL